MCIRKENLTAKDVGRNVVIYIYIYIYIYIHIYIYIIYIYIYYIYIYIYAALKKGNQTKENKDNQNIYANLVPGSQVFKSANVKIDINLI